MIQRARGIAALVIGLLLSGCAGWTHLTKSKDLSRGNSSSAQAKAVIVDAKQRLITSSQRPHVTKDKNGQVIQTDTYIAFCAEPSPDALSALAAGFGITLSKQEKADLASNLSIAEGAGSIGLRTQSIQLMRDAMFRLCEGYQSGAIDDLAFQTLHRRFQSSMVAILAIEQVTGAVRAPAIAIGGTSAVGNAELAADLTAKKEAALVALRQAEETLKANTEAAKTAEATLTTAQKALADEKDETKKPPLQKKVNEATEEKTKADQAVIDATVVKNDRASALNAIEAARAQAVAGGGSAATTVRIEYPAGSGPDSAKIADVAKEVTQIVTKTLELNFAPELCATVLLQPENLTTSIEISTTTETKDGVALTSGTVVGQCLAYLHWSVQLSKANATLIENIAKNPRDFSAALLDEVQKIQDNAERAGLVR